MKNKLLLTGIAACLFLTVKTFAQVPTASFSISQPSLCAGKSVQLTDASSNSPTSWSYTLAGPANVTSVLQNPTLTLNASGDYTVTLVATNGTGDSAPVSQTLTVKSLPTVTGGGVVGEICAGSFITLSGAGASTYTWTGSAVDGVAFAISATTIFTVTGTDTDGCENDATVMVTVNPLPVLSVSGSTSICIGAAATLTVSGATTYSWSTGGLTDNISDSPVITTTYSAIGTDAMTTCSTTITKVVTVNNLPVVTVNSGNLCTGSVFTLTPGGASTYVYSNGSNTVSPLTNESFTVTGTDANGCVNTVVSNVTVSALPVISVNTGTICSGTVFTLNPTGAVSYSYSPSLTATVNPSSTTSYSVIGTDANGCVSPVAAVSEVTVFTSPVSAINSGSICAGQIFTMTPTNNTLTFTFPGAGGTNTVSPSATTSYTVIGEDAIGCQSREVSTVTVVALPVVTVNSGSICAGSVFTMVPQGASTYVFSNGINTVSPTSNTSYSVLGTSIEGCVASADAVSNVTVNAIPAIAVTSGSVCLGSAYTMTASGASTYIYQGGSSSVSPSANSTYTVTGVSAEGCPSSNTATANVTVMALPVLSIASATAICEGASTTLTVTGASSYTWNVSNSNLSSYTVTPLTTTTYTVYGSGANGCSDFATQAIVVNSLPTITVNSGTICPGASFIITPSGALVYSFTGGSATVTPASTTNYSVTGTDANGCISASAAVSTVNVASAIVLTVAGNTTICTGQTANLTASGATTYSWNATTLTSTIAVNPTANTSYTVTGITGACSKTAAISVSVNPLPVVTVSSSWSVSCKGENVTLTPAGALNYSWNTGAITSTVVVAPTVNTTYTVTGTDANSCSNKTTITQNVTDCTGLAKFENTAVSVGVYPNPTNGEFTLSLTQETSVNILNGIGQVVYTNKLTNGETVITLNNQPNGIYFVQLKQGNNLKTVKVVKN